MTTSGKEVYLRLYEAVRNLESDSRSLSGDLSQAESEIRNWVSKREELFSALAKEYLPEMDADSIKTTLNQVQYDVQRIFEEKERYRQKLEIEVKEILQAKREHEEKYNSLTEELNRLAEKRTLLEEKVSEKLRDDQPFAKLCAQASVIGERIKQYRQRSEEVRKEAEEKLPDFGKDPLFAYLLNCHYGNTKYKGKGLRKRLDRWVARQVDFSTQLRNFQFLQTTPEIMKLELEREEKELAQALSRVDELEKSVADDLGLTTVREQGLAVGDKREGVMVELEGVEEKYAEIASAREELENDRGHFYREAIKKLKGFLESQPVSELRSQAAKQAGKTDDLIVEQINNVEKNIEDLRETGKLVERKRSLSENQLEGLGRICAKYRRKDFDSARSFYERGFTVGSYIESFLSGTLTEANFWSGLVQNQNFSRPARAYNPVYEHLTRGQSGVAGGFGRALGEMILSGELGRRRSGVFGSRPVTRRRVPERRRPSIPDSARGGLGGGGFSSGSGF